MSSHAFATVSDVETPTSASSMDPAAEGIRRRAPLAKDIRVSERCGLAIGGTVLAVPPFLRMLESTLLRSAVNGPICVVLPTVEDIAPVIAVLASLELHALDLPSARARFRADGLSKGQRVRLLPSGDVFEIAERTTIHDMPGFWLRHIQLKNRGTLPRVFIKLSDVDRFEPTIRFAPAATGKTKHGSVPPPNDIDEIVGERSYGNTGLNTTRVFVTGSLAGFERTLQSMPLCPLNQAQRPALTLERIFSFGRLDDDGRPYVSTPAGSIGQPMVCIGHELMDFRGAALSDGVAPGSRLFLTDRIELVMRDLDLAARIGERQRMVLLAQAADREDALALRGHGWTVWEPSPEDLADLARPQVPVGIRGVDVIERAARTETTRHPGFLHCANRGLEFSEPSLIVIGDILGGEAAEHDERLQDARGAAQSAFFQAAGLLDFGEESEIADLRQNLVLLRKRQGYVAKYAGSQAGDAVDAFALSLERFLAAVELRGLTPKGERVLRAASDGNGSTSNVFVAGNRSGAIHLRAFMARHSIDARCVNVSELREQLGIASVMAMNVMRRDLFARVRTH